MWFNNKGTIRQARMSFNSLRPSDAYMRQWSNQHWFRQWLAAWSAPSHYQDQCWNIVNKTLRNKLQWIFSRNSNIFIQQNVFESVVCEKAAILSRPQWVKLYPRKVGMDWPMPGGQLLDWWLRQKRNVVPLPHSSFTILILVPLFM